MSSTPAVQIEIKPLSGALTDDFLCFFDGPAFSDNPGWSSCYCQCFYEDHRVIKWSECSAARNRDKACERISLGLMQGYLAFVDGVPVGWCNAAPRRLLRAMDQEPVENADDMGVIICFLVAPAHRGQGIARRLLEAACDGLRGQGLSLVEANPRTGEVSAAENHFGPLGMYLSAGFSIHREDDDGSVYVRRAL